ncbi:MAG: hypothetical protein DYG98_19795 [Haliscomenobacteraceae bacterium CHB4]|nr:hypothetical protein [Haliscomenobacteraceae bacterium CHB4]
MTGESGVALFEIAVDDQIFTPGCCCQYEGFRLPDSQDWRQRIGLCEVGGRRPVKIYVISIDLSVELCILRRIAYKNIFSGIDGNGALSEGGCAYNTDQKAKTEADIFHFV